MSMNRRRKAVIAAATAAVTIGAMTVGVTEAHAHPKKDDGYHATAWGLIINVKNDSTHDLRWLGDSGSTPKNTPIEVLHPGEKDRLVYKQSDGGYMTAWPTYQVDNTEYVLSPGFSVPLIGKNSTACSSRHWTPKSPVGAKCDIGKGWEPDAHLTFVNV
jgi:hypothetical protein